VAEVHANTAAARAGLSSGDVLLRLEEVPIAGVDDLHRALTSERAGVPTALTLLRRAELLRVPVTPDEA
jgi:S1-C subfamily serine protease